jgi:hypothetical protein
MRVDADGLTVFPVGLTEVCSSWNDAPGVVRVGNGDTALGLFGLGKRRTYDVAHGTTHLIDPQQRLRPHLIEDPILIPRSTGTMA